MEFNFPDNKTIFNNTIQNFSILDGRPLTTNIDILNPLDNLIELDGVTYFFTYLNGAVPGNKGGNSILLRLYQSDSIDVENIEYGEPDLILKILRFKKANMPLFTNVSERRFLKEIEALKNCYENKFQNIIRIFHDGLCKIRNTRNGQLDQYLFYTMEYADFDLKKYIETNHSSLEVEEKISLCKSLCEGLAELYSLGYYHRDIKPDNIFMIDDVWKIGDLGLLAERNNPHEIDKVAEPIGPKGWMSPESMNKYLCEEKGFKYNHNCIIDHQSDIFQLGKVFWYIFQYNAPIGEVKEKDFLIKNSQIYSILKTMLRYSKKSRYKDINEVARLFKLIEQQVFRRAAA